MDLTPVTLVDVTVLGAVAAISHKALTLADDALRGRISSKSNGRAVPYDQQLSRIIFDVSQTLSQVAVNQTNQTKALDRLEHACERMADGITTLNTNMQRGSR